MILVILVVALLLFLVLSILWHHGHLLKVVICAGFFLIAVACSLILMLNDVSHLGMKEVAVTTTTKLQPTINPKKLPVNLLMYKQLGTGSEKVYLYKPAVTTKVSHTDADVSASTQVIHSSRAKTATVTITKTKYQAKNSFWRVLYYGLGLENQVKQRHYRFTIPVSWQIVSVAQLKRAQQRLKHDKPAIAQAMKQQVPLLVKQQVTQAMQKNPTMSSHQRVQVTQRAEQQAKQQIMRQFINKAFQ
ncbi:DUF4811 domain-containing protein [Ligilactobacillus sp. LYQ60]|uniref:DUF4811 domain-containing protein n=1 Tax=unclassified Ligilactobacillus TaxID=2767920 RepID=UPI0038541C5E